MPIYNDAYSEQMYRISQPKLFFVYSKEPSQSDGSFEHPEQMLKLLKYSQFYNEIFTYVDLEIMSSHEVWGNMGARAFI